MTRRILVIGIDGGTFDLILPLVEGGIMPNLGVLMNKGSWGVLKSTIPPITAPAWTSFITGRNPGKHGCFDFFMPKDNLDVMFPMNSNSICCETLYEYLHRKGLKSILINLPETYPPKTSDIMISSLMTQGDNCVFPEELKEEIKQLNNYKIVPKASKDKNEWLKNIRDVERVRFECATKLLRSKEWDLFFILFSGIDWIQHNVYGELRNNPTKHAACILYSDIDSYIGKIVEEVDDSCNIFIVSDHGFKSYKGVFYINEWLIRKGYLTVGYEPFSARPQGHLLYQELIGMKKHKKKIKPFLNYKRTKNIWKIEALVTSTINKLQPFFDIDKPTHPIVRKSVAYCTSSESKGIYINSRSRFKDGIIDSDDYHRLKKKLIDELCYMKDPNSHLLFSAVYKREEIFNGPETQRAPDILLEPANFEIRGGVRSRRFIQKNTNGHSMEGIFIAHGSDIKNIQNIHGLNIVDVSPTITYLLGLPIADDVDGRIINEIIKKDILEKRPIIKEKAYFPLKGTEYILNDDNEIRSRLRDLGYLG